MYRDETVCIIGGCTPSRSTAVYRQDDSGSIQVLYSSGKNIIFSNLDNTEGRTLSPGAAGIVNAIDWRNNEIVVACNDSKIYFIRNSRDTTPFRLANAVRFLDRFQDFALAGCIDSFLYLINLVKLNESEIFSIKINGRITSLKLLPLENGKIILALVGTSDSQLKIFQVVNKKFNLLLSLEGHSNWISCISLFGNGGLVATGSNDKSIRIWKISYNNTDNTNACVESNASALKEFIPLKDRIKVEGGGILTFELESVLLGHEGVIHSLYFDNTGRLLSSSSDGMIMLWEKKDNTWQTTFQVGHLVPSGGPISSDLYDAAIFPSNQGDIIVAHCSTGTFLKWIGTQLQPVVISGHIGAVECVAWSSDGSYLVSTSSDKSTRVYSSSTFREIARPQIHGYEIKSIALLPPDKLISAADEKIIRVFKQSELFQKQMSGESQKGPLSAKRVVLPALGLSNKEESCEEVTLGDWVTEVDLCRDTLWPEIDKLYSHGDELYTIAVSPDCKYFASAARTSLAGDSAIRLWDAQALTLLKSLPIHKLTAVQLAFSPDSTKLLSVSRDRTAVVYDIENDKIIKTIDSHSRIIWTCAWLDNQTFFTAGRDGIFHTWTLKEYGGDFKIFEIPITASCVVDKETAVIGFENGNVLLLNPLTFDQYPIVLRKQASDTITNITYNPSKSLLAISSKDHLIRIVKLKK